VPGFSAFEAITEYGRIFGAARSPCGLDAATKLDDAAAVTFGGPALGEPDILFECLAFLGEVETRFAAGIGLAKERLRHGRGAARRARKQNFDLEDAALVFNAQLVSCAYLAGRLGAHPVRLNAANVTGARGQSARFEEARGPKPFVDANRVHREARNSANKNVSGFLFGFPEI